MTVLVAVAVGGTGVFVNVGVAVGGIGVKVTATGTLGAAATSGR